MPTAINRRSTTEDDITAEVLRRFEATSDVRLREIMLALVRHMHGFVKDVNLTEGEWFSAIQFLTETGQMCDDKRQEFILLSDTLGVSMVVDHFVVSADGYQPVTTHIFDAIDPYLSSDAVFAVKDSLICEFVEHTAEDDDARRLGAAAPFCTARFDFVLQRA